jgi:hypothetical protein
MEAGAGLLSAKRVCLCCEPKLSATSDLTEFCATLDLWSAQAAALKAPIRLFEVYPFHAEQKHQCHVLPEVKFYQTAVGEISSFI